jgi:hypothetical protein
MSFARSASVTGLSAFAGIVTMARSATEIRSIRTAQILYLALFHESHGVANRGDRCLANCSLSSAIAYTV